MGKQWKQWQTLFSCTPKSLHMAIAAMQLKDTCSLRPHGLYSPWNSPGQNTGVGSHSFLQGTLLTQESTRVSCIAGVFFISWATREALLGKKAMTNLDTETSLCRQRYSQSYGFSSSHVQMWESDQKEGWASENWCFQIVVLEKTLESPNPKGNQPWIFTGWTECEAETPILQPTDAKSWLTGEDSDAGKDWGQEKGMETEDEMVESITDSVDMSLSKLQETVKEKGARHAAVQGLQRVGYNLATEQQPEHHHQPPCTQWVPKEFQSLTEKLHTLWWEHGFPSLLSLCPAYTAQAEVLDTENNSFN